MRLPLITNRNGKTGKFVLPQDGWFQIAPLGEFGHPSGITQVIDPNAIDAMVKRFEEEAKEPNFPGLLLDFDHFSNDAKAPSEAAGWIEALSHREHADAANPANGLWARIRFSDVGEDAVVNGRYRLASPVWNRAECESMGGNKFRPQRLDRCALTNDPVLKGMVPLSNRLAPDADPAVAAALDELRQRLDAVEAALSKANALTPPEEEDEPGEEEPVVNRSTDRTVTALHQQVLALTRKVHALQEPVHNRRVAKTPTVNIDLEPELLADGQAIANRAAEIRKLNPGMSQPTAFVKAARELEKAAKESKK